MNQPFFIPLGEGFLLGMGLIVGFGPQNSFVLQQGVKRSYVFIVALFASLVDLCLIALGVGGAGHFFAVQPSLVRLMTLAGAAFLVVYGWKSFAAALSPRPLSAREHRDPERSTIIVSILAVSLLNPSAYVDTLLIIGSSAARYETLLKTFFAIGAALASIVWFFSLAFGAANFSKLLSNKTVLRLIDFLSGSVMWFIASRLLLHAL